MTMDQVRHRLMDFAAQVRKAARSAEKSGCEVQMPAADALEWAQHLEDIAVLIETFEDTNKI